MQYTVCKKVISNNIDENSINLFIYYILKLIYVIIRVRINLKKYQILLQTLKNVNEYDRLCPN